MQRDRNSGLGAEKFFGIPSVRTGAEWRPYALWWWRSASSRSSVLRPMCRHLDLCLQHAVWRFASHENCTHVASWLIKLQSGIAPLIVLVCTPTSSLSMQGRYMCSNVDFMLMCSGLDIRGLGDLWHGFNYKLALYFLTIQFKFTYYILERLWISTPISHVNALNCMM